MQLLSVLVLVGIILKRFSFETDLIAKKGFLWVYSKENKNPDLKTQPNSVQKTEKQHRFYPFIQFIIIAGMYNGRHTTQY